jgi:hypothetical protein
MTTTAAANSSADKLAVALGNHPGHTTKDLALTAGIGRSTASTLLAAWEAEGKVTRNAERNPATWAPTEQVDASADLSAMTDSELVAILDDAVPAAEALKRQRRAAAPKPEPKRKPLPEGMVSPSALAKVINERGLYKGNREEGLTTQAMYSYIRNAPAEHPFPLVDAAEVGGRDWIRPVEDGVTWWTEKDERVANRPARTQRTPAERRAAKRAEDEAKLAEALAELNVADPDGGRSFSELATVLLVKVYGEV